MKLYCFTSALFFFTQFFLLSGLVLPEPPVQYEPQAVGKLLKPGLKVTAFISRGSTESLAPFPLSPQKHCLSGAAVIPGALSPAVPVSKGTS